MTRRPAPRPPRLRRLLIAAGVVVCAAILVTVAVTQRKTPVQTPSPDTAKAAPASSSAPDGVNEELRIWTLEDKAADKEADRRRNSARTPLSISKAPVSPIPRHSRIRKTRPRFPLRRSRISPPARPRKTGKPPGHRSGSGSSRTPRPGTTAPSWMRRCSTSSGCSRSLSSR